MADDFKDYNFDNFDDSNKNTAGAQNSSNGMADEDTAKKEYGDDFEADENSFENNESIDEEEYEVVLRDEATSKEPISSDEYSRLNKNRTKRELDEKKKQNKVLIVLISVLAVLLIGIVVFVVVSKANSQGDKKASTAASTTASTVATTTAPATTKAPQTQPHTQPKTEKPTQPKTEKPTQPPTQAPTTQPVTQAPTAQPTTQATP